MDKKEIDFMLSINENDNYDNTLPNLSHEELLKLKQESKKE